MNYRLSIVLPCKGRPLRTRRSIECILGQTATPWQAFILGDNCPIFQELLDSGYISEIMQQAGLNDCQVVSFNSTSRSTGYANQLMDYAIEHATGEFFMWFANDDVITQDHFEHYLSEIEGTDLDLVYYNSYIAPHQSNRISHLAPSCIGHSEIIARTSILKQLPKTSPHYGHDWETIAQFINHSSKYKKAESEKTTYHVLHLPSTGTVDVID